MAVEASCDATAEAWYIVRELYGSGVICVSNRSKQPCVIVVDTTECRNVNLVGPNTAYLPNTNLAAEFAVAPNSTAAVAMLQPTSGMQPVSFAALRVVCVPALHRQPADSNSGDPVMADAAKVSEEVERWLSRKTS